MNLLENVLAVCEKLMQHLCAFLYWSMILHLQWPGLGSVWARPTGHQFCGHIHLHLGHQVRISMFLHFGEITGTLFCNYQLAGQSTPWWELLFSCASGAFSYFPLSPRWLLFPSFQASSESVMGSRVVQLSYNCLASLCAHFRYFPGGFSWSPKLFLNLLGIL